MSICICHSKVLENAKNWKKNHVEYKYNKQKGFQKYYNISTLKHKIFFAHQRDVFTSRSYLHWSIASSIIFQFFSLWTLYGIDASCKFYLAYTHVSSTINIMLLRKGKKKQKKNGCVDWYQPGTFYDEHHLSLPVNMSLQQESLWGWKIRKSLFSTDTFSSVTLFDDIMISFRNSSLFFFLNRYYCCIY